jgi:hypothetical protein
VKVAFLRLRNDAFNPPATVFTDVQDVLFDSTIRYDESFYAYLNRIVQDGPWLDRDRAMIDQLRTLSIASSSADCTLAGARLISSARMRLPKIGPLRNSKLPRPWRRSGRFRRRSRPRAKGPA